MTRSDEAGNLRGFRLLSGSIGLFLLLFAATAPWQVAGREIARFSAALAFSGLLLGLGLVALPRARRIVTHRFLSANRHFNPESVAVGGALAAAFLYLVVMNRYRGFEVNAWDFSFYDRPLARPLEGGFLFNPIEGRPLLATHAYFVLLPFLPLYAIHPSAHWLLAAQSLAIAGAAVVAFYCFRRLCGDDMGACLLAFAFVLNDFTAKAVRYVFHPEIFYPLGLFLVILGLLTRRRGIFVGGLVASLAVKEDALLPLVGLALTASVVYRRHRWSVAALAVSLAAFALDYSIVLPHAAGGGVPPWYSHYWAKYGSSPINAAGGMFLHPFEVARDVWHSGAWRLAGSLGFAPLLGYEWLIAAAVVFVPYGASQAPKLGHFLLYYSMPVLPLIFAAAAIGLPRIASSAVGSRLLDNRARQRLGALLVLLVSAFCGAGYRFTRPQPADAPLRLAKLAGDMPLSVQGALLPHIGYEMSYTALKQVPTAIDGAQAFLLAPDAKPYPLAPEELRLLVRTL